jgi:hypothetical protein
MSSPNAAGCAAATVLTSSANRLRGHGHGPNRSKVTRSISTMLTLGAAPVVGTRSGNRWSSARSRKNPRRLGTPVHRASNTSKAIAPITHAGNSGRRWANQPWENRRKGIRCLIVTRLRVSLDCVAALYQDHDGSRRRERHSGKGGIVYLSPRHGSAHFDRGRRRRVPELRCMASIVVWWMLARCVLKAATAAASSPAFSAATIT